MGRVVGIDLGTTTSIVATVLEGEPTVIPNSKGEMIIPSVVSFLDENRVVVGTEAKDRLIIDPSHTVYSVKRLIGRKIFSREVKKAKAVMPYKIVEGPNQGVRIDIDGKLYSPEEISALILKELKKMAEEFTQEEVTHAVITVPAHFSDSQRQSTKDAGEIAGLEVLKIINEPTAAALAYGFGKGLDQKVVIFDLGGGTFDVSILSIHDDVFEVISTAGDDYLGGDDFDDRIIDYLAETFYKETGIDLRSSKEALQKLKKYGEEAKKKLSSKTEVEVVIPDIIKDESGKSLELRAHLSRNLFSNLTYDLVQRSFKVCDEALQNAHLTVGEIDNVILVGGSTKMPIIKEAVENYFFKTPLSTIDPELVVATGAAIHASSLMGDKKAAAKSLLIDVTSRSLGIETVGGLMEILIPKNSPVPTESTKVFTTVKDNQEQVKIKVYQGESRKVEDNELLGTLTLSGIPPAPRGKPKIEVTFEIDTNGIVNVSARDLESGKESKTKLNVLGGMSSEEVQKAKERAELISV